MHRVRLTHNKTSILILDNIQDELYDENNGLRYCNRLNMMFIANIFIDTL